MAIFWDEAFVTVNDPAVEVVDDAALAGLGAIALRARASRARYRETPDGPEVFDHGDVSTRPRWEDVPGRVTRLGDVTDAPREDRRPLGRVQGRRRDPHRVRRARRCRRSPRGLAARLGPRLRRLGQGLRQEHRRRARSYGPWPFHAMSAYPYPASEHHPDPTFPRGDAHARGRAGALPEGAGGKIEIVLLARGSGRLRRPTVGRV